MYAQLGGTIFKGLLGFDSFSRSRGVKTVDIELINNKPRIQRTGEALATLSLSITLASEFVDDIPATIQGLYTSMSEGEILPLLGGDGTVFGDFIIIEILETIQDLSPSGVVTEATVQLELKEWVDKNPIKTQQAEARRNGFAVGIDKVVPINVLAQGETLMGATVKSVRTQQNAAIETKQLIEKATVSPSEQFSLFKRAIGKIDITRKSVQEMVLDLLQNVALQELAPGLLEQAQTVSNNADNVRISMQIGNLTNAVNYAEILEGDLALLRVKALPIDKIILQRKPQ